VLFATTTLTAKLSVLSFYYRVFTSRAMRLATQFVMGFVVLWGIGSLLQVILVCHFRDGAWYYINPQTCPEQEASFIAYVFSRDLLPPGLIASFYPRAPNVSFIGQSLLALL
jgi:hypothetical protein